MWTVVTPPLPEASPVGLAAAELEAGVDDAGAGDVLGGVEEPALPVVELLHAPRASSSARPAAAVRDGAAMRFMGLLDHPGHAVETH
jgi:hypothetical protein